MHQCHQQRRPGHDAVRSLLDSFDITGPNGIYFSLETISGEMTVPRLTLLEEREMTLRGDQVLFLRLMSEML